MGSFSYHVGQRIKKYRKSRGYTIEQFSTMINKSKATLSKYENGTITIDIETLYDIAQALNIDLKCFIDYQPPVFHQEQVLTGNFYFNTPQAYMYYFDGRIHQLVRSLLYPKQQLLSRVVPSAASQARSRRIVPLTARAST